MLAEPRDLSVETVLATVRAGWDPAVTWAEHLPVGSAAFHWQAGADAGPRWFVTVDPVADADEDRRTSGCYAAAAQLSATLDFVLAPAPGVLGETSARLSASYLLSVAPYVEGQSVGEPDAGPGRGRFADDQARADVASMLARLHTARRPAGIPTWQPRIGWRSSARRQQLDAVRNATPWDTGPLAHPAWQVVTGAAPLLDRVIRRFDLLAGAASGSIAAWVPTHGEPHADNVLATPGGPRLVDWATLAVAPPERDLRHVLPEAEGNDPELAYLASGGAPRVMSEDLLELFALEAHVAGVAGAAAVLAGPHQGGPDDERALEGLDTELAALSSRWG